MSYVIKAKAAERSAATANDVALSTLVRIFNNGAGVSLVTVAYANTTTYATLTVAGYSETLLRKSPTDTVQGTNILASGIAVTG